MKTLISRLLVPILVLALGFITMPQTASAQTQQQADDAKANAIAVRNIALLEIAVVAVKLGVVTADDNWYTLSDQAQANPNLSAAEKAYAVTLANQCQNLWDDALTNRNAGDANMVDGDANMNSGDNFYANHMWSYAYNKYNLAYNCYQAANGSYLVTAYDYEEIHILLGVLHTLAGP